MIAAVRRTFGSLVPGYADDRGLAPRTERKLHHQATRWAKHTADPDLREVTRWTFEAFRESALAAGLSPVTIEGTVGDVLTVLNWMQANGDLDETPSPGRRLRRRVKPPDVPALDDLDGCLLHARAAVWPRRVSASRREALWRAWYATAYFTGFRRADLLDLRWSQIGEDSVFLHAEKTGKVQQVPLHPVLRAVLKPLRRRTPHGAERVFPFGQALKQLRREMKRIAAAAGVRYATCQMLRRLAATEYEKAKSGAGALILGHALRGSTSATAYYVDVSGVLREASRRLAVPGSLRDRTEEDTENLRDWTRLFWKLAPEQRRALQQLGEGML